MTNAGPGATIRSGRAGAAEGDGTTLASVAALGLAVGLGVLTPAFLVADVPDAGRSNGWWLTLGVAAWSGVRLGLVSMAGRPRLFSYFFWLFCYVFLGIGATVQLRSNEVAETTPGVDPALDVPAALVVIFGIALFEVGQVVARRSAQPRPPGRSMPVSLARGVLLLVVGLLMSGLLVSRIGVSTLFTSREGAAAVRNLAFPDPAILSIVTASSTFPLLVGAGVLAQARLGERSSGRRLALALALAAVAGLLLLLQNPIVSARYTFGTVAFALIIYAGAARTPARLRATMGGTVLGFLFVFPVADAFRYAEGGARTSRTGFFSEYAGNGDYDSFWQVANAYLYWQEGFVEPLRQFLGSVLFWVPRAVWADKPTDTGILLADYRGYTFDNLSAPMWAEALVNGGLVAVVIVFFGYGFWVSRLDDRVTAEMPLGGVMGVVGAVFPVYTVILLRGSWLQATGALGIAIACTWAVAVRKRQGSRRGRPSRTSARGAPRSATWTARRARGHDPAPPSLVPRPDPPGVAPPP